MLLPDWMLEEKKEYKVVAGRKSSSFLKKSLRHMQAVVCEDRQTEYYARCDGMLQRFSPQVKLVAMLALILAVSLSRRFLLLLAVWVGIVMLMYWSRLPVWKLQTKIWGFIPLLTLLFSVPAMLNLFTDGTPILYLQQAPVSISWLGLSRPEGLFITRQGLTASMLLFIRVGLSLSLGILLVMTTPVADVFKSLRVLRVPSLFIMIMEMTYRYMMVLLLVSIEMFDARSLRTVGNIPPKWQRAQAGSSIAALFARSVALSEEVYQAMCARCYTGESSHYSGNDPGIMIDLSTCDDER
ncbi:MAG TPA: cobalt ECF transporter T component CbiQ [Syntrophomonas sp.]|nr:cobalt ECF transporter T component CbiQ [Syntrophomonas sp.]